MCKAHESRISLLAFYYLTSVGPAVISCGNGKISDLTEMAALMDCTGATDAEDTSHCKGEINMATKKAMTKTEVVKHFAEKFDMTKQDSKMLLEELAELAVTQTKKVGEFTIPGIGKLVG